MTRKEIRDIRQLLRIKGRKEQGRFIVEGRKCVASLLSGSYNLQRIYATAGWAEEHPDIDCCIISSHELSRISALKSPQEVVALVQLPKPHHVLSDADADGSRMLLDGVGDPGNVGTLIRTALWFGFRSVICCNHCADIYNPKTVQATMGALFDMEVVSMSAEQIIECANSRELPILAADVDGRDVFQANLGGYKRAILALGSESHGLSPEIRRAATHLLCIPGSGKVESLNVAVSGAIIAALMSMN